MTKTDISRKERELLTFFIGKDLNGYYYQNDIFQDTKSTVSYGRKLLCNLERQGYVKCIKVTIDNSHFLKVRFLLTEFQLKQLLDTGKVPGEIVYPILLENMDTSEISNDLLLEISSKLDKIINLLVKKK